MGEVVTTLAIIAFLSLVTFIGLALDVRRRDREEGR